MVRINLLPASERAALSIIQPGVVAFSVVAVLVAAMAFQGVYLGWLVTSEAVHLNDLQRQIDEMLHWPGDVKHLDDQTRLVNEQIKPFEDKLQESKTSTDLYMLFTRVADGASNSQIWIREVAVNKDGTVPITGYAVEFPEVSKFLSILGKNPMQVEKGSSQWIEQNGIRFLQFQATATGGGESN